MKVQQTKDNRVFALDRFRILAGMSQGDVEEQLGIKRSTYSAIETLSYNDLNKLAELFGVKTSQLFLPEQID